MMWLILTGVLAVLLVYARTNTPVFSGEKHKTEQTK